MTELLADPYETITTPEGVEVHLQRTDKYKTTLFQWNVEAPMDDRVTDRALLSDLLTRGTRRSPGMAEMAARCEEMFATEIVSNAYRLGDRQVVTFGFEAIADRYADGGRRGLFDECVGLLDEVLSDPPLDGDAFRADHFEQERSNLVRAIEGLDDDKGAYAFRRLMAVHLPGTPWSRHAWGTVDEARALDEPHVRETWRDLTASQPVRMFVVGDVSADQAVAAARRLAGPHVRPRPVTSTTPPPIVARDVVVERERQPLSQSKLALGFRIAPERLASAAAPMFAMAFGGGSHSRLFKTVREEHSLAYSAYAGVLVDAGSLIVQAGVDAANAEKARGIVVEELERFARDGIDEEELELSRRAQRRRLEALRDAPGSHCNFRHAALVQGRPHDLDRALARIDSVTPDDVVAVAADTHLDAEFLLEGTTP